MSDQKLKLEQIKLSNVLASLEDACSSSMDDKRLAVDATIKRFQYSIELFWKYFKRIFEIFGREVSLPKAIMQEAYTNNLISNEKIWVEMILDRNQTSHTYKKELADEIYFRIRNYYVIGIREVFNRLSKEF